MSPTSGSGRTAKHEDPPDRQPEAIKLVLAQMEQLASRYADERAA